MSRIQLLLVKDLQLATYTIYMDREDSFQCECPIMPHKCFRISKERNTGTPSPIGTHD
jgi:hypothetical protein